MDDDGQSRSEPVLGILGGMGPDATINFQQQLLDVTPATREQDHVTTVVSNVPKVPDRNEAILEGSQSPLSTLRDNARALERYGVDLLTMPCNTAHYYADGIVDSVDVEFLDMIDAVAETIDTADVDRAGLVATKTVIDVGIYREYFASSGVELVTPDDTEQLMDVIYAVKEGAHDEAAREFASVVSELEAEGCDALVVGCSDLSVLPLDTMLDVYDPVRILARWCVEQIKGVDLA
jgi:aspartate racemase